VSRWSVLEAAKDQRIKATLGMDSEIRVLLSSREVICGEIRSYEKWKFFCAQSYVVISSHDTNGL